VRFGWTRFAGLATHLALVVMVLGAAIGAAFAGETAFSLLPGDQALLDAARPGFTDAIRLDRLDAAFGADDRPTRLDTAVTFLRDGAAVEQQLLQVNRPGSFGPYLVHAQSYGPAARLRVTTLEGRTVLDGVVPLDERIGGADGRVVALPPVGMSMGVALVGEGGNRLQISLADASGVLDAVTLAPGEEARIGGLLVAHDGLDAYVSFLSRQDPGLPILFLGAGLLSSGLAVALWLPRRRLLVTPAPGGLLVRLRGERFDDPSAELERVRARLEAATIRG
jgi:cytochrome c biogenesis protein